jgi:hypothetical protein
MVIIFILIGSQDCDFLGKIYILCTSEKTNSMHIIQRQDAERLFKWL